MRLLPRHKSFSSLTKTLALSAALLLAPAFNNLPTARASDHGDSPAIDQDSGADIGDIYFFLDPTDNSKAVMILTVHGFIVPGEAGNFGTFDPNVKYIFQIENTGDATPDMQFTVRFAPKANGTTDPQIATIRRPDLSEFTAPSTPITFAATPNEPVITTDPTTGVDFFAGETDDPFFFDQVAFNRYIASVKAGTPNAAVFQRGRDAFAGYNILSIVLRVPVSFIKGNSNTVGVYCETRRGIQHAKANEKGGYSSVGPFKRVDRAGNPAINVALIPYNDKDAYNASSTEDDAAGKFVDDIMATLKLLGTDAAHMATLASVAVTHGDMLHLDLTVANNGTGGGNNAGAGFPNGRRLGDDVIDTILTIIANGAPLGDNVNGNDVPFRDVFPYLAPPHQPLDTGIADDNTRN